MEITVFFLFFGFHVGYVPADSKHIAVHMSKYEVRINEEQQIATTAKL